MLSHKGRHLPPLLVTMATHNRQDVCDVTEGDSSVMIIHHTGIHHMFNILKYCITDPHALADALVTHTPQVKTGYV